MSAEASVTPTDRHWRGLTLLQPWATLITMGVKTMETRSWSTDWRGGLIIHAGKGLKDFPMGTRTTIGEFEVERDQSGLLLRSERLSWPYRLPLGVTVAVGVLTGCVRAETVEPDPYGWFAPGRWAWKLTGVERCAEVPVRGQLGLWEPETSLINALRQATRLVASKAVLTAPQAESHAAEQADIIRDTGA